MKLYYSKGACSLAVRILINELDLPCAYEAVNLKTKQTASGEDFLKVNAKGNVPTLVTDDNKVLTENAIIQQYLAETHKATQLLPAVGNFERYKVLEWLNFITTDLHKGFSPFFNPQLEQEIKDTVFKPGLKKKFDFVNAALTDKTYLLGEKLTLPDAYLFVVSSWLPGIGADIKEWPNLAGHHAAMKERPAVQKSLQEEAKN